MALAIDLEGYNAARWLQDKVIQTDQSDAGARQNFAAEIYGGPFGVMPPISGELPPVFMAWAQDDAVAVVP